MNAVKLMSVSNLMKMRMLAVGAKTTTVVVADYSVTAVVMQITTHGATDSSV
jgi:hypothetical protein